MKNHRLSLPEVDALIDQSRKETLASLKFVAERTAARAAARAARDVEPSLEEVTLNNSPLPDFFKSGVERGSDVWTCKLQRFSSGVVVVRATQFGNTSKSSRVKCVDLTPPVNVEGHSVERFASSIVRSKRTVRERCMEGDVDHLLTLTKRGKFSSCDDLWKAFNRFNVYMSRAMPNRWRYVAVPELHADGVTWHMHCAIKGFIWAPLVRRIWQKALGGTGHESGENSLGNIDLKHFRKHRSGAAAIRRIASYIAKYIGKGFDSCNRGRRLFASSREFSRIATFRFWFHDIERVDQLAVRIQQWLHTVGSDVMADCYHWSRHRRDETLLMRGFILTTFLKVGA